MMGQEVASMFVSVGSDVSGFMLGVDRVAAGMAGMAESSKAPGIALLGVGAALLAFEGKGFMMGAEMDAMFTTICNNNNTTITARTPTSCAGGAAYLAAVGALLAVLAGITAAVVGVVVTPGTAI